MSQFVRLCYGAILTLGASTYSQALMSQPLSLNSDESAELVSAFQTSCAPCHSQYGGGSEEQVLNTIISSADRVTPRLASQSRPMPPANAPTAMQLTTEEKRRLIGLIEKATADSSNPPIETDLPLDELTLPKGFKIEVIAEIPSARSMTYAADGILYVGTGGLSNPDTKVYGIPYIPGQSNPTQPVMLATGLDNPNGVTVIGNDLYVAERTKISRYRNAATAVRSGSRLSSRETVFDQFPNARSHSWKYLRASTDGELFVAQGAPCNICDPESSATTAGEYLRLFAINPNTGVRREVATGIRNTVGFDWDPVTADLWFTDNGRDQMGDDLPPDELNRISATNQHFGYPYCHGTGIRDPQFGRRSDCSASGPYVSPMIDLPAHVAALGMRFYRGDMFPSVPSARSVFIAEHGSWNRSVPDGYRVSRVIVSADGERALSYESFVSGWLNADGSRWGRPVDIENLPDGSILISDDYAGVIYRLYYAL
ncbi:MAG: PQQ-dependent sugar dehydrogenase [Pseudobacteriovorax sp.]|nr:PQQ-dependent sugar dehydrogenase [Pseudobacteriovorax sp.]